MISKACAVAAFAMATGAVAPNTLVGQTVEQPAVDTWSLSELPTVAFGTVEGDSGYVFGAVRALSRLEDGRIVVADQLDYSIRVYGPTGRFEREIGRRGDGPGEFRALSGLWTSGSDTIRVWDSGLARVSTFLADGRLVWTTRFETSPPEGPGGALEIFGGTFSDGDVALGWTVAQRAPPGGLAIDRIVFGRFAPHGAFVRLMVEGQGLHRYNQEFNRSPVPFSPFPRAVVARDSLHFMNGVGGIIAISDPDDGLGVVRIMKVDIEAVGSSEAWAKLRERIDAEGGGGSNPTIPNARLTSVPSLAGILADDQGRIWVKVYDPGEDSVYINKGMAGEGGEWLVLSADGAVVARVSVPDGMVPMHVSEGSVVGVQRDALDVDRIVVHSLISP